ncbi:hypothetical protein Lalb_Chr23g0274811 [Lupinus albus]|uniref:Uncharacterized protein n=1 Tax=Lupinus albus TaxID=3870 RepID=A0A6A4NLV6_LUPAL|nr:hypothetical protein Lalb_Chr23g0274811 [Lupinus albus]
MTHELGKKTFYVACHGLKEMCVKDEHIMFNNCQRFEKTFLLIHWPYRTL